MQRHRASRWLIAVGIVAVVATACSSSSKSSSASGSGSTSGGPSTSAGAVKFDPNATLTYSLEQEPTNFNILTSDGNNFYLAQIIDQIWPSVFRTDQNANVVLDTSFATSATQTSTSPQTIVYQINPNAAWSDGTPITADDFIYNWQIQSGLAQYKDVDGSAPNAASTAGYSQIKSVVGSNNGKTVTVVFSTPFPDWKSLFGMAGGDPLAPAHLLSKIGFNTGLLANKVTPATLISGGPFEVQSYTPGQDLIIVRNTHYWGTPANLASVTYRFITQSSNLAPALQNNEVQAGYPQPQLDLITQLKGLPNVKIDEKAGLQFEHLDFNTTNKLLSDVNLRKAIAMAIDRPGLIARTYGQIDPGLQPLNDRFYVSTQPQYKDNSGGLYDHANVSGAKALLAANGYTYSGSTLMKNGQPVTLRITSSQGNALRQSEEAVIINDEAQIGIKLTEVDTASLGKTGSTGDFDLFLFGWVDSPFASGNDAIYESPAKGGANSENFGKIDDPKIDSLITQADGALDSTQQAALYNQADAEVWAQMYTLPLFQKPTLLVYNSKYVNMYNDPTLEGPTFNEPLWGVRGAA